MLEVCSHTSTLAGVKARAAIRSDPCINTVECPGATIDQVKSPFFTELAGVRAHHNAVVTVAVCAGLNDLLQGRTAGQVMCAADRLKADIKAYLFDARIVFMPLPLPPVLVNLPDNQFQTVEDRLEDILIINNYFRVCASDVKHDMSLEKLGINEKGDGGEFLTMYMDYRGNASVKMVGRRHVPEQWRERDISAGLHLSDRVRAQFWREKVVPFFT